MKLLWKRLGLGLFLQLLFAATLFTGCASGSDGPVFSDNPQPPPGVGLTPSASRANHFGADADRFHVGETVIVDFSGLSAPEMQTMQEVNQTIKGDGTVSLPYIGNIVAAGKTPGELQNDIYTNYVPEYFRHLTVTVKSQARVYYVGGQVNKPGVQEYLGQTTVTKAIQAAGDFNDFANRKKVKLTRAGSQKVITVNCVKALQDPALDPPVYPGDSIHVPRRIW